MSPNPSRRKHASNGTAETHPHNRSGCRQTTNLRCKTAQHRGNVLEGLIAQLRVGAHSAGEEHHHGFDGHAHHRRQRCGCCGVAAVKRAAQCQHLLRPQLLQPRLQLHQLRLQRGAHGGARGSIDRHASRPHLPPHDAVADERWRGHLHRVVGGDHISVGAPACLNRRYVGITHRRRAGGGTMRHRLASLRCSQRILAAVNVDRAFREKIGVPLRGLRRRKHRRRVNVILGHPCAPRRVEAAKLFLHNVDGLLDSLGGGLLGCLLRLRRSSSLLADPGLSASHQGGCWGCVRTKSCRIAAVACNGAGNGRGGR